MMLRVLASPLSLSITLREREGERGMRSSTPTANSTGKYRVEMNFVVLFFSPPITKGTKPQMLDFNDVFVCCG
jgi:hypothetical protein